MKPEESLTNCSAEVAAVRDAYAALNRGDASGFVESFDPEVVRVEFEELPSGGSYHGLDAVTEHVREGRSTWAEGACELIRIAVAGDNVIAWIHVNVRLNGQTEWINGRVIDVFTFRNAKVVEFRSFLRESDALDFARVLR